MLRTLQLHSLRFVISTDSFDLDPILDALYTDNELPIDVLPSVPRSKLAVTVELGDPSSMATAADRMGAVFAENNLCGAPCYFAEGRFGARIGGIYPQAIEYDPDAAALRVVLGGRFANDPQAVISRVVRPVLQSFLLPFHGLKSLHGAIVERDGRGIFLAGPGGAGKTTTALAFGRQGWTILSDDGPLFALTDQGAVGLSSLDYLHASGRTLALFPELRHLVVGGPDHRAKFAVSLAACGSGDSMQRPVVVDRYVRLQRGGDDRPRLADIPKSEVLRSLVAETMTVFRAAPFRNPRFSAYSRWCLSLLASFTTRAQPFLVEYGDKYLHDIPALLESTGNA